MSTDHHRTISSASAYDDHDEMAAMELRPLVNNNNDIEITIESTAGRSSVQPKIQVINLKKESVAAAGPCSSSSSLILTGINVGIPKGTIVGIVGPSGSGKSTFLRALNRLWEPPSGTVFVDGYDVCSLDVVSLRRKVGMLFQVPALFEGTVGDNVRFGPKLRDKKRVISNHEVCKLLSLADLEASMIDRNCNELSVGQAQRVALARTLANQPEVLLLDEPTSALDPISTQNIEDALLKLKRKQGMTIVMVSHSIQQVQRIADKVCLMVDGSIVEVLIPHQLSQAKHPMALKFLHLSS